MRITILGCGPAGLMAAQAVQDASHSTGESHMLTIVSRKRKSPMYGAQYLHRPIPNITPMYAREVKYTLRGYADDYRRKVYGTLWDGKVSPEDLTEQHQAWDIRATYDMLWSFYEYGINDMQIDPFVVKNMLDNDQADLIISTIPRALMCHMGHAFGATEIWAAGDDPEQGLDISQMYGCPEGHVICNGEDSPAWYRMSRVFGRTTVEWPGALSSVPVATAARVRKPTTHDCDCWKDEPIMFSGRYGEWSKGVLSHETYFNVYKELGGR